jgi:stage II sporulation protein AA (anti-sigma F factor antagonist)
MAQLETRLRHPLPAGVAHDFAIVSRDGTDGTCVLEVSGPVALHEARCLERIVLAQVRRGRRRIVLDLRTITTLGTGLLGAVLRMRRGLSRVEGDLVLIVDGPPADALVQASVLDALVPVVATLRAATGRFRRPEAPGCT